MLGIRRSFSSTNPFWLPIIKGKDVLKVSFPPSISRIAVAFPPSTVNPTHEVTKLYPKIPAIIPGTIPPL